MDAYRSLIVNGLEDALDDIAGLVVAVHGPHWLFGDIASTLP